MITLPPRPLVAGWLPQRRCLVERLVLEHHLLVSDQNRLASFLHILGERRVRIWDRDRARGRRRRAQTDIREFGDHFISAGLTRNFVVVREYIASHCPGLHYLCRFTTATARPPRSDEVKQATRLAGGISFGERLMRDNQLAAAGRGAGIADRISAMPDRQILDRHTKKPREHQGLLLECIEFFPVTSESRRPMSCISMPASPMAFRVCASVSPSPSSGSSLRMCALS